MNRFCTYFFHLYKKEDIFTGIKVGDFQNFLRLISHIGNLERFRGYSISWIAYFQKIWKLDVLSIFIRALAYNKHVQHEI